jgi:hypothetical protein
MAVTIRGWNNDGPATAKCCQVAYGAGDSLADIIQAVENAITARGWVLYDAAAGANARCYRYPCLPDAEGQIAYSPLVLNYNTAGYLLMQLYESWNPTTHVGTNLANNSNLTSYAQRIDLTYGGDINIATNQGLLLKYTRANSNWGCEADQGPTWVGQSTRVHALDTVAAGYPRWYWTCTATMFGLVALNNIISFPRTRNGVNNQASCGLISDYGFGGYLTGAAAGYTLMPAFNSSLTGSPQASNVWIKGANSILTNTESLGTMIGILTMTRTQNANIGGEAQVTVSASEDHAGLKIINHDGVVEMWHVVGAIIGTQGRVLVEK